MKKQRLGPTAKYTWSFHFQLADFNIIYQIKISRIKNVQLLTALKDIGCRNSFRGFRGQQEAVISAPNHPLRPQTTLALSSATRLPWVPVLNSHASSPPSSFCWLQRKAHVWKLPYIHIYTYTHTLFLELCGRNDISFPHCLPTPGMLEAHHRCSGRICQRN